MLTDGVGKRSQHAFQLIQPSSINLPSNLFQRGLQGEANGYNIIAVQQNPTDVEAICADLKDCAY